MAWIRGLYAVENEAKTKELDDAQRLTLRQEQSRPILETIKEWLDKEAMTEDEARITHLHTRN